MYIKNLIPLTILTLFATIATEVIAVEPITGSIKSESYDVQNPLAEQVSPVRYGSN